MLEFESPPQFRFKRPVVQINYYDQTVIIEPSLFDMETYIQITKAYQDLLRLIDMAEEIGEIIDENNELEIEILSALTQFDQLWADEAVTQLNLNPDEIILIDIENNAGNKNRHIQVQITLENSHSLILDD